MSTRVFCYDTEFLEDGRTIELISIGIVCDDGSEYYAVNSDMPVERIKRNDWLMKNVWPQLPLRGYETRLASLGGGEIGQEMKASGIIDMTSSVVKPAWVIANEVREFITDCIQFGDQPALWADYGAYDHVVLAQLYGSMINLPLGIPMFTHELQQLYEQIPSQRWERPDQTDGEHNALQDARYNLAMYRSATTWLRSEEAKAIP